MIPTEIVSAVSHMGRLFIFCRYGEVYEMVVSEYRAPEFRLITKL